MFILKIRFQNTYQLQQQKSHKKYRKKIQSLTIRSVGGWKHKSKTVHQKKKNVQQKP